MPSPRNCHGGQRLGGGKSSLRLSGPHMGGTSIGRAWGAHRARVDEEACPPTPYKPARLCGLHTLAQSWSMGCPVLGFFHSLVGGLRGADVLY